MSKNTPLSNFSRLELDERFYPLLFNAINDALFVFRFNGYTPGKFIEVNQMACERLGYSKEELLAMSPLDINANGDILEKAPDLMKTLVDQGSILLETEHQTKNGRIIPVENNAHYFLLDGKPSALSIARDITERKRSDEALRREEEKLFFQAIQNSGKRLVRTIHEILDISSIEAGTYDPHPVPLSLETTLRKVFNEFRIDAERNGLDYRLDVQTKDSTVFVDEQSLGSLLSNLLDNAVKYTRQGGITVSLVRHKAIIQLDIQDSGEGIDPEYLERIYEPFTQESEGYTRKYQGVGIGMALVKKYCDLNDIKIDIRSDKGKGTDICLLFRPMPEQAG